MSNILKFSISGFIATEMSQQQLVTVLQRALCNANIDPVAGAAYDAVYARIPLDEAVQLVTRMYRSIDLRK